MRRVIAPLLLLLALEAPPSDAAWRELLARAAGERKPVVVLLRTADCERCDALEQTTLKHPTIERRLPSVVFGIVPGNENAVALYDRGGREHARWPIVPDTMDLGILLDAAAAVAPHLERAVELGGAEGELEIATALARLGRFRDARAALAKPRAARGAETRQRALLAEAMLDANEGKSAQALAEVERIAAAPATPDVAGEAANVMAAIRRALEPATRLRGAIRILPPARQVVSGRHVVRTHVATAGIARVVFSLDGREVARVNRPPFSAAIDFGAVPERHAIRVAAFDRKGTEIAHDERVVNEAGETFWLRLTEPREGPAEGRVLVRMNVRVPPLRRVRRVVLSWNDAERAVLTAAPWEVAVEIPDGQVGVLRAVAELDDGRTSEDAVLLNAGGFAEHANVQLAELPITLLSRRGAVPELTPGDIVVREGNRVRPVESIAAAAETPLTVGLLIDVSASMHKMLPDLQEAAIRFLDAVLGERDRAFVVAFDSRARLVQPATSDKARLREQIMRLRPEGLTALHDAMVLGLLQFEGIKGRRAMIVFTDGVDRTSEYDVGGVSELARRVNVPIHFFTSMSWSLDIAAGAGGTWVSDPPDPELFALARRTGGTSHTLQELGELPAAYARIEQALRAQILAFVRTDPATRENEWRPVKVEVKGAAVQVLAPEGYYATW